jgi:hypothetical protein
MDPFHFACPHCSSPLRVREKLLVGRQVECPECGEPLVIVERAGQLAAEPAGKKVAADRPVAAGPPTEPPSVESHRHQTFFRRPSWAIATGIAAVLAAVSITLLLFSSSNDTDETDDGALADREPPRVGDDQDPGTRDVQNVGSLDGSGGDASPVLSRDRLPFVADDDILPADTELAGDADSSRAVPSDDSTAGLDDDDQPLDPEFAPEPAVSPKINLALSLKQPIIRFDQPRTKPLEAVLVSVAEMAGTRIIFDRDELGPAAARLSEPMALRQDDTTVGEILTGLLRPAGLAWRIEGDHLRLVRAE